MQGGMIQGFKKKTEFRFPNYLASMWISQSAAAISNFLCLCNQACVQNSQTQKFLESGKGLVEPHVYAMNMSLTIVFSLALTGNQHFFNVFVFRGKFRIVTLYFDKNSVNQTIVLQSLIDCTHVTLINDFPSCMFYSLTLILISKWNVLSVV